MSRASGAGAYSQLDGAGTPPCLRSSSVNREVVRALIAARPLLPDLHEHVVQQGRGTDAIQVRREPVRAERLVELDEILDGLLGLPDAAGGLHSDHAPGLV